MSQNRAASVRFGFECIAWESMFAFKRYPNIPIIKASFTGAET